MTIEVSRFLSEDLYVDNASLLFDRRQSGKHSTSAPPLGAVTFLAVKTDPSQKLQDLAVACGREAFSLVREAYKNPYKCWLFVSDGPWREATRIVLHQRLWKSHRDLLEAYVSGIKSEDVEIKVGNKVRYAGLVQISEELIEKAIDSVRVNSSFAIIFSRRSDIVTSRSIEEIFWNAFTQQDSVERTSIDWMALAVALCAKGDVLLRVSGLFDDNEAAADLIATPQNLPCMVS